MDLQSQLKVRKLRKGDPIAVFPFSRKYGDPFTAVVFPCPGSGPDLPVEIEDPFRAEFIGFEDSIITVVSDQYGCLVIDVAFVRDIEIMF